MARFRGHGAFVNCLAFSRDGRYLASGGADRAAFVWDVAGGKAALERDFSFIVPLGDDRDIRVVLDPVKLEGAMGSQEEVVRRCQELLPQVKDDKYGDVIVAELRELPDRNDPTTWLPNIEWKLKDLATFEVRHAAAGESASGQGEHGVSEERRGVSPPFPIKVQHLDAP